MHTITIKAVEAKTLSQKSFGLLGKKPPRPMLFRTRFGIHTFGMRYPLDVIVLDTNRMVVVTKENLAPNRIFLWNPMFATIIELPSGYCKKHSIKKGTNVKLIIE